MIVGILFLAHNIQYLKMEEPASEKTDYSV